LGGGGSWNTTGANWGTSSSGPFTTVWNNANSDSATLSAGSGATGGGVISVSANITMNGTLTWQQTPGSYALYSLTGPNTITFSPGSAISCNNSQGGGTAVGTFSGPYAGTITKSGAQQLEFNNANGSVTKFIFNAGTASFASFNRFGSGPDVADFLTFNGGKVRMNTTTAWTMGRSITVNSSGGSIIPSSSAITLTQDKPITWNGGTLNLNRDGSTGFTCHLQSTTSSGAGTLMLQVPTTCDNAGVIPSGVVVSFNSSYTTGPSVAALNLNNKNQTIASLTALNSAYTMVQVNLGTGTLTLANGTNTFPGIIGGSVGSGGLTKQGTGTEILSGANTYSGVTLVQAGTLAFSGASTCSGPTTVSSNATLSIMAAMAFPNSPIVLNNGAILDVNNLSPTIAALSGSGVVTNNSGQTLTISGNLTTGGGSGYGFQNFSCYYNNTLTNCSISKDGAHSMAFRTTNVLDTGTISFGSSGSEGTLSVGAVPDCLPVSTSLYIPSGATFQLDANSQNLASFSGYGNINLGGGTSSATPTCPAPLPPSATACAAITTTMTICPT
jgi:autotransporter-associated beta strand protein